MQRVSLRGRVIVCGVSVMIVQKDYCCSNVVRQFPFLQIIVIVRYDQQRFFFNLR